jgi:hypothetical protein
VVLLALVSFVLPFPLPGFAVRICNSFWWFIHQHYQQLRLYSIKWYDN